MHPSRNQFVRPTRSPLGPGISSSKSGPVPEPPSAQSPFARSRRYRPRQGVQHLVGGHYPSVLARMGSCDRPNSSVRLRLPLVRAIFAGCCQPLLEVGPSRRYLRSLCQVAWTRTPPRLWRSRSVCVSFLFGQDTSSSPELRPRPSLYGLGTRNVPCMATSTGCGISGLQSFANVQASSLARPPGCAHRCDPQGSRAVYVTQ
jgi:hypothetical protein